MKIALAGIGALMGGLIVFLVLSRTNSERFEERWHFLTEAEEVEAVVELGNLLPSAREGANYSALTQASEVLETLSVDRLEQLAVASFSSEALQQQFRHRKEVREILLRHWARKDPEAAVDWALKIERTPENMADMPSMDVVAREYVRERSADASKRLSAELDERDSYQLRAIRFFWLLVFEHLLYEDPGAALRVWKGLGVHARQDVVSGLDMRSGTSYGVLAADLKKVSDFTDRDFLNKVVADWIRYDGNAAFRWMGKEMPLEKCLFYCSIEPLWKKVEDGPQRWAWVKRRIDDCGFRLQEKHEILGGNMCWHSPKALDVMLGELKYDHQRDETHVAAALSRSLQLPVEGRIEHLRAIENFPKRQQVYVELVQSVVSRADLSRLLAIIDEMDLTEVEREALLNTWGVSPDSDR